MLLVAAPSLIIFYTLDLRFNKNLPSKNSQVNSKNEVLGTEDEASKTGSVGSQASNNVTFNIPAIFNELVTFRKGIKIAGGSDLELDGNLKLNNKNIDLGSGIIQAANVISKLTGGTGISIGGTTTNPVISNTGVTSLQSKTGDVALEEGDGIKLDGLKITNDDPGSSVKSFSSLSVGDDTLTASSSTDSLTISSGEGISLLLDSSSNTLTISGTSTLGGVSYNWPTQGNSQSGYLTNDGSGNLVWANLPTAAPTSIPTSAPPTPTQVPPGFDNITSGTNTQAEMIVGNGSSLDYSGTGSINASTLNGKSEDELSYVNNTDSTLTKTGTGPYTVGLNLGNANTWTGEQTFSGSTRINADTVIAPVTSGADTLTLRAGSTTPGNILNLTSADGNTSFLSVSSTGTLNVNGSSLTNAGLLESGGAIKLTDLENTLVGTAVKGGWTLNSNKFTYRRTVTVTNNDETQALPQNYEVTVTLSGSDAAQVFSNTRSDHADFHVGYNSTEIPINVTSYTSSNITFTFQLRASIAPLGNTNAYAVYYSNPELTTLASSYINSIPLDALDDAMSHYTSSDTTQFPISEETETVKEGTSSLKVRGTVFNITPFSSSNQTPLTTSLTNFGFYAYPAGTTSYLYALGGTTDGTSSGARSGITRLNLDTTSGNITSTTNLSTSLPEPVTDSAVVTFNPAVSSGDGSDGSLDLSLGGIPGGCYGNGLSWSGSTCTLLSQPSFSSGPGLGTPPADGSHSFLIPSGIHQNKLLIVAASNSSETYIINLETNDVLKGPDLGATASAGSHSFSIMSGSEAGKILTVIGGGSTTTRIYDPATNTYSAGPDMGAGASNGSHSFTIQSGLEAGKTITNRGGGLSGTRIYDPATNTYSAGPDIGATTGGGSHSFAIQSGSEAGKVMTVVAFGTSLTRIYNPATNTYSAGPSLGLTAGGNTHSFTIPSGPSAGKVLTVVNGTSTTRIYDPATNTYSAGPDLGATANYGTHSFTLPSGPSAGKILTVVGSASTTRIYDPATNTYSAGPSLGSNASMGAYSFVIPSGSQTGKVLTILSNNTPNSKLYDPTTNAYSTGPIIGVKVSAGSHSFTIPSGIHKDKTIIVIGNSTPTTKMFDPLTNTFSPGPDAGANITYGSHSFTIPSGSSEAGKILTIVGSSSNTRIYDPATNTYSSGPDIGATPAYGSHSFLITSGLKVGKILTVIGNNTSTTRIYDPVTNSYEAGPGLGITTSWGTHSFFIPSGQHIGKVMTINGMNSTTARIYDPETNTFIAGPSFGSTTNGGAHSFVIPNGALQGKILTILGNSSITKIYDPTTNTYSNGPDLGSGAGHGANSFVISSGALRGKILTLLGNSSTISKIYNPITNTFVSGPDLGSGFTMGSGGNSFEIGSGPLKGAFLVVIGNSKFDSRIFLPGKLTFNFSDINIPQGTFVNALSPFSSNDGPFIYTLNSTGNIIINGTIDLRGLGYSAGYGPGTPLSSSEGGCGGSYGGMGGTGGNATCTPASVYTQDDSGSGGGAGNINAGAAGGGAITINSTGNINISNTGSVLADGASVTAGGSKGAGGSGGLIKLQATNITNNGSLSAKGGNGGGGSINGGGGGGAGRIILTYSGTVSAGTISLSGGVGGAPNGSAGQSSTPFISNVNPFVYVIGGRDNLGGSVSTISQAEMSLSNGNLGNFTPSSTSLPAGLYGLQAIVTKIGETSFLHIIGGNNGSSDQSTVNKMSISSAGVLGTGTTSNQSQLPIPLSSHSTTTANIGGTNYVWVIGGKSGSTAQSAIYKGVLDASGDMVSLTSSSQTPLPISLYGHSSFFKAFGTNRYIYIIGGTTTGGVKSTGVYKAQLDSSGNVISVTSEGNTQLSEGLTNHSSFVFTDSEGGAYAYTIGGISGSSPVSSVKKALINSDQTGYNLVRSDFVPIDLSNKNDITFWVNSSLSGSFVGMDINTGTVSSPNWQPCSFSGTSTFSISITDTWVQKGCNVSAIASRSAVTGVRVKVVNSQTTPWTMYFDDMRAISTYFTGTAASIANSNASLGSADLTINSQGEGKIVFNYDSSNSLAGTGGISVFNGGATKLFDVSSIGTGYISGKLGIGTTSPTHTLDVVGDASISSDVYLTGISAVTPDSTHFKLYTDATGKVWKSAAGGADLAEYYSSKEELQMGEIVSIDLLHPKSVVRTTKEYERHLLGVVSSHPYEVMGMPGKNEYAIGLVGKVPVIVTNTNGDIKTGDEIVSSSLTGAGMRSGKSSEESVGRALESTDVWSIERCQAVESYESIEWISDKDLPTGQECYVLPDNTIVGKILMFVRSGVTLSPEVLGAGDITASGEAKMATESARLSPTPALITSQILKNLIVEEGLSIIGDSEFKGKSIFASLVEFMDGVFFRNTVVFNNDTAGYAVIQRDDTSVDIEFIKEYEFSPIVNATLNAKEATESAELNDAKLVVTNITTKGFKIVLSKPMLKDVEISWVATAVKDARIIRSTKPTPTLSPDDIKELSPSPETSSSGKLTSTTSTPIADKINQDKNASEAAGVN